MTTQTRYLRYDDGFWPHTLAVVYAFGGYVAGFALILFASWPGKNSRHPVAGARHGDRRLHDSRMRP